MIKVGRQNLITDVPGIKVGNFHDQRIRSGVTVKKDKNLLFVDQAMKLTEN